MLGEVSRIGARELWRRWLNAHPIYEREVTAAGAAGQAQPGELDEVLAGDQPGIFDSALERGTRSR